MSLLSLKIGYLKTTLQLTNQMKIDNLISQLICCMTCIPSTIWWRRLRNWEILSTICETNGAFSAVPLKVRRWVTIYGTRIGGTTSFLYLMNMRAFAGYIWVICQQNEIIRQKPWTSLSGTRRFKGVDSSFLRRFSMHHLGIFVTQVRFVEG